MLTLSYNGRIYHIQSHKQDGEYDIVDNSIVKLVFDNGYSAKIEAMGVVGSFRELPPQCVRTRLFISMTNHNDENGVFLYYYNGSSYHYVDGEKIKVEVVNENVVEEKVDETRNIDESENQNIDEKKNKKFKK